MTIGELSQRLRRADFLDGVGIYVGAGNMIHAPYTGTNVQVAPLQPDLVGAGRPARAGH